MPLAGKSPFNRAAAVGRLCRLKPGAAFGGLTAEVLQVPRRQDEYLLFRGTPPLPFRPMTEKTPEGPGVSPAAFWVLFVRTKSTRGVRGRAAPETITTATMKGDPYDRMD